ncbi:hypothetical protein [Nocardia concava]|uniref:hypothetical protein n=1 Tax=Nocardia concava TaxID=257281 RepID=UPI0002F41209|nr:hypothetical protein [Nocardia concava]
MEPMHKSENYWVPRNQNGRIDYHILTTGLTGHGVPAVRYDDQANSRDRGLIVFTAGGGPCRSSGHSPYLTMSVSTALVLVDLLLAAIVDARIAEGADLRPVPHRDITWDRCTCALCADDGAVR